MCLWWSCVPTESLVTRAFQSEHKPATERLQSSYESSSYLRGMGFWRYNQLFCIFGLKKTPWKYSCVQLEKYIAFVLCLQMSTRAYRTISTCWILRMSAKQRINLRWNVYFYICTSYECIRKRKMYILRKKFSSIFLGIHFLLSYNKIITT